MLDFHIVIPARLHSTRLAQKLLRPIDNKFLLQHTIERALSAGAASVTVAADDIAIVDALAGMDISVLMTKDTHETGTDRLAETVDLLGLPDDALVVNLQGDEPLMPVGLIQQVAQHLANEATASVATLYEPIVHQADLHNPAIVKMILNHEGFAVYFSRAAIPFDRDASITEDLLPQFYFRHLGLYAYRAHFLRHYAALPKAPMEQLEKLEQLRVLYAGYAIAAAKAAHYCPPGVDTEDDLLKIIALLKR